MDKPDLFKPQIPLLPTNGAPFAAYLFLWFFPNVTSINLSRTDKIKVTPANGNSIKEKGKMDNPSPPVQTIQQKEQPLTEPNVGGRKPPGKREGNLYLLLMKPQI